MIRIILSSKDEYRAEKSALEIEFHLSEYLKKMSYDEAIQVLGPAQCVLKKIKEEYRYNILIKNQLGEIGHKNILKFIKSINLPQDIKMVVDIDPSDIL